MDLVGGQRFVDRLHRRHRRHQYVIDHVHHDVGHLKQKIKWLE